MIERIEEMATKPTSDNAETIEGQIEELEEVY